MALVIDGGLYGSRLFYFFLIVLVYYLGLLMLFHGFINNHVNVGSCILPSC